VLSSLPLGVVTTAAAVPDDGRACRVLPFFSFFSRRDARLSSLRSSRLTEDPSAESRCMCVEGAGGFRRPAEGPALPPMLRWPAKEVGAGAGAAAATLTIASMLLVARRCESRPLGEGSGGCCTAPSAGREGREGAAEPEAGMWLPRVFKREGPSSGLVPEEEGLHGGE
jgi:hypothetical protein